MVIENLKPTVNVNLQWDDGFGFAVSVACDDRIGSSEIQLDAGNGQSVLKRAISLRANELVSSVIIIRLFIKCTQQTRSNDK